VSELNRQQQCCLRYLVKVQVTIEFQADGGDAVIMAVAVAVVVVHIIIGGMGVPMLVLMITLMGMGMRMGMVAIMVMVMSVAVSLCMLVLMVTPMVVVLIMSGWPDLPNSSVISAREIAEHVKVMKHIGHSLVYTGRPCTSGHARSAK
jgi:hypothetical protein